MKKIDWIQSIGLAVAIVGLMFTLWSGQKQLQIFNDQLKLNFFADYTQRYQDIILNLPENINAPDFDFGKLQEDVRNKTFRYMRVYFNLCSEEFHLWKTGYIEDGVWQKWGANIEYAFQKKAYRDAWEVIKLDTMFDPEFSKWVNWATLRKPNEK